jgi:hypothetical protein
MLCTRSLIFVTEVFAAKLVKYENVYTSECPFLTYNS